jgi:adenosylcobyric acid synthase
MTARAVMVWGCTSGAGKSWITTALCRYYAQQGVRVAPFKAQNMSNHARVVAGCDGAPGEIGSAQYFQALAAGVLPDVRMNPVLLKPEADTRSQVVLLGRVDPELSCTGWRERSGRLAQVARTAYAQLAADYDLILIEGAGSPAETNLAEQDYVNLGAARWSAARCLLVSDIDRGGSFAHLYGTYALIPADVRSQLAGFVLNRFRGDPGLLAPAPQDLQRLTGVETVGVIPYVHGHGLPEEDALPAGQRARRGPRVVVLAGPAASNLDEFECLVTAGVAVEFARRPAAVVDADWVILPGSKQALVDLAWLRQTGLAQAVIDFARAGGRVLGICGGLQILGRFLEDPHGLEGGGGETVEGLGLLPTRTAYERTKWLSRTSGTIVGTTGVWAGLRGFGVSGYEIHAGVTQGLAGAQPVVYADDGSVIGWQEDSVLGLYLHGFFEQSSVMRVLFGLDTPTMESTFDRLAAVVGASFAPGYLDRLVQA